MEMPSAVTEARSNAAKLGSIAAEYAGAEFTIPDQLRKTVQEALDYNKDVIGMRSTALADYMSAGAKANTKFGVQQFSTGEQAGQQNQDYIFNPFERNSAIQGFIANESIPFYTANTLLGMREGTIADTVDAGTRAFQAQSAASQAAAMAAQQTYQNVLNEFTTMKQLEQEQQKIDLSKKAAAGSGTSNVYGFLRDMLGGGQQGGQVLAGMNQPGGPMGPMRPSPFDAAVEEEDPLANDPLFGPIIAAQKKRDEESKLAALIGNVKLPQLSQKTGILDIPTGPKLNLKGINMSGLNMSGTTL